MIIQVDVSVDLAAPPTKPRAALKQTNGTFSEMELTAAPPTKPRAALKRQLVTTEPSFAAAPPTKPRAALKHN